jgi:cardiolipin synthase A/B
VLATIVGLLTGALIIAVIAVWSIKRHRDPRLFIRCDTPFAELLPSLSGLSHGTVYEGNRIEVLEDGAFFDALIREIRLANRSVHFETFLWKEGHAGGRLVDALTDRARAGVSVRVLVDANGGKNMGKGAIRQLQAAGCKFDLYHPHRLRNIGVFNERDHRKIVVLDGQVAIVGGHCIHDCWFGERPDGRPYRDISVRLTGPAVHAIQSAFSENWVEETGELIVGEDVFPRLSPAGDVPVHVARMKPEGSAPAVKILHHMAICCAQSRIWIQNPYFLPEPTAIEALGRAVSRGVDVRIMVPSASVSDMPIVQHAAHRNFRRLLTFGVRIFEYQRTLLHQKIMCIDGVWCAVGSSNFDDRSFEINDEITLGIMSATLTAQFEAIFERDVADCTELRLFEWQQRGWMHRVKDHALYLFNEVM